MTLAEALRILVAAAPSTWWLGLMLGLGVIAGMFIGLAVGRSEAEAEMRSWEDFG